ncbi:MAG: dockerin type I repeat-containing protein [Ruminococcus sp.]|nr:dockerin type I repeat-containing protein [Ruminococcus sp.]
MKKKILISIISALTCCIGAVSTLAIDFKSAAEGNNRDKVYDSSLILDEEVADTLISLNNYMYQNDISGYTTLLEDKHTVEVVCFSVDDLEKMIDFADKNNLNSSMISYIVDESSDLTLTNGDSETPVTNDELEKLVITTQKLNEFIMENEYSENSAYASLKWNKHSVWLFVKNQEVHDKAVQFISDNDIETNLVDVIISPEYDFRIPDGGAKDIDEVNPIVAGEYLTIRDFLKDNGILSNIFLTTKQNCTFVEITVREQEDVDILKSYLTDNYYWQDVIDITVQSDLSADTGSTIHYKDFVCLDGDSNDDGIFSVADVVMLQKYLFNETSMCERQGYASDLNSDGVIDVFDLCLSKQKLIF